MAAYSKRQEHRSFSSSDYPYTEEVQRANKWLEEVLSNNQRLNKRDYFRLTQFLLAAQRQISNDKSEKENLLLKLVHRGDEGLQLGLSLAEISATSRLAIELKEAGLLNKDLLKKVEIRIRAK